MTTSWWLVPASYLLGSISFSLLLVSLLERRDLRLLGSGNAGATNVMRVAGKGPALLALVLDIGKGALAVWTGQRLGAPDAILASSAVAVVLGHVFPAYHSFRGGKGVATAAGALGVLQPAALAISGLVFLAVVVVGRYVSLASIVAISVYPLTVATGRFAGTLPQVSAAVVVGSAAIALLVVWKHRDNIARLRTGVENRLGGKERTG